MNVNAEHSVPAAVAVEVPGRNNSKITTVEQTGAPAYVQDASMVAAGITAALQSSIDRRW